MEDVKDDYRWYKGCVKHCKLAYENDKRERTIRTYYPLAHHPAPLKIIFQNYVKIRPFVASLYDLGNSLIS